MNEDLIRQLPIYLQAKYAALAHYARMADECESLHDVVQATVSDMAVSQEKFASEFSGDAFSVEAVEVAGVASFAQGLNKIASDLIYSGFYSRDEFDHELLNDLLKVAGSTLRDEIDEWIYINNELADY